MKSQVAQLRERYRAALQGHLAGQGEVAALHAYELGRQALADGLGLFELTAVHAEVVGALLADPSHPVDCSDLVRRAESFLSEALSVFEMAQRGFIEANTALRTLNATLARRVAEQTTTLVAEREARHLAMQAELEEKVAERTAALEASNKELEAFSYSISHDLRAPLRAIDGFIQILQRHATQLDDEGKGYLDRVSKNAKDMGQLIDDLLAFSRLGRTSLEKRPVALSPLVQMALEQLRPEMEGRAVDLSVAPLPVCQGEPVLLEQVFVNLIGNALKYSRGRQPAHIEVGCLQDPGSRETVFFVRDDGVGFDMQYAGKLFGVFHRLHRAEDYEGTGVGLAIVQRIVQRHGGRVWAEAETGKGATFYFTLGGSTEWQAKAA
jgi:light-regulated signal transduction histidine kinase (bacteriophytochrome)